MNIVLLSSLFVVILVFSFGVKVSLYPEDFGSVFGYRTKNSMRSEYTWIEGNNYAGRCLMLAAPLQIIVLVITENYLPAHPTRVVLIMLASVFVSLVVAYIVTEMRLSRLFFKDGKRKPNTF